MFNTTIWRSPVQFETVWKAPSAENSLHNQRRICPGLDCPTHCCWQQGLAVRAHAANHRRGHAEELSFTDRSSFTRQEVSCQSFLPLVQKSTARMFIYSLYPGRANGRALDNYSLYKSTRIMQRGTQYHPSPAQSHKHNVCRQVPLEDSVQFLHRGRYCTEEDIP